MRMNCNFTDEDVKKGYRFNKDCTEIVFIFAPSVYKSHFVKDVYVGGSFTGWISENNYRLNRLEKSGLYTLKLPVSAVNIPGNSGVPEFKFWVRKIFSGKKKALDSVYDKTGYTMRTNKLIVFPDTDMDHLIENINASNTYKLLKDFDLNSEEGKEEISNVRLVPGTARFYRGYHPYKLSRPEFETEKTRNEMVKYFFEKHDIQSVITLSGEESCVKGLEELCQKHKDIIKNGNQLYINTDYEIVYFQSNGEAFGKVIAQIVRFINSHPAPFYIHCRLGTDRTGTTSASIAALCGADWTSICEDYEKTNRMGIGEFRDRALLKHCFENILGKKMEEVADLENEFARHFIKNGYLGIDEIECMKKKLTASE